MSEQEPRRLTDQDRIEHGIKRAEEEERIIDDTTARIIAASWHSGQSSALYSLASTGCIDLHGAAAEMLWNHMEAEDEQHHRELDALAVYIATIGSREPVEGWHESTKWGEVEQIDPRSGGDRA